MYTQVCTPNLQQPREVFYVSVDALYDYPTLSRTEPKCTLIQSHIHPPHTLITSSTFYLMKTFHHQTILFCLTKLVVFFNTFDYFYFGFGTTMFCLLDFKTFVYFVFLVILVMSVVQYVLRYCCYVVKYIFC